MKHTNTLSKFAVMLTIIVSTALFTSCQKDQVDEMKNESFKTDPIDACDNNTYTLWAGQNFNWGDVTITSVGDNIYVKFEINQTGFWFVSLHLWMGMSDEEFPQNSQGVPIPGQFPHSYTPDNEVTTEYTFVVPLTDWPEDLMCDGEFIVMAHATITNGIISNTAWGGSGEILYAKGGKSRWYYLINDYLCCEESECNQFQYQTAYAGDSDKLGKPWFYYFTAGNPDPQIIWAGQNINIGTATLAGNQLTITLINGWEFVPNAENLKIQGYSSPPTERGSPGQYAEKFTETGSSAIVMLDQPLSNYYLIHLDVRLCLDE